MLLNILSMFYQGENPESIISKTVIFILYSGIDI